MDPIDAPFDPQKTNPHDHTPLIPESLYGSFGKYQILEKIGQGGMGAVYRARDTLLEREVAIKVPLLGAHDRVATLGRFSREAIAAASLSHPVICSVYEYSEYSGIPFIVTPFLHGKTLQDQLEIDGPWSIAKSLLLAVRIAAGLEYAHQKNVIHRDIKPQNILLERDSGPMILDFGLAKVAQGSVENWTQSGEIVGTPAYMAPEQIDSTVGPTGPSCDIYALGMTLYRMLTGRTAFSSEASFAVPQILLDPPRPPSAVIPDRLELLLVDSLILKALAKKPGDRFATMGLFAMEMEQVLNRFGNSETHQTKLPNLRILGTGRRYHPSPIQKSIRIGRQRMLSDTKVAANDLVIRAEGNQERSLRISRQHLEIVVTQQGMGLLDRSQAGVAINGKIAKKDEFEPRKSGDIVSVAGVVEIEVLQPSELNTPLLSSPDGMQREALGPAFGLEATMGDFYQEKNP